MAQHETARHGTAQHHSSLNATERPHAPGEPLGTTHPVATPAPRRWGPASWWRLGLVALLALLIGIALSGGAFWTATPVDAPR